MGKVFRDVGVTNHAQAELVDLAVMADVQRSESVHVALANCAHQFVVTPLARHPVETVGTALSAIHDLLDYRPSAGPERLHRLPVTFLPSFRSHWCKRHPEVES